MTRFRGFEKIAEHLHVGTAIPPVGWRYTGGQSVVSARRGKRGNRPLLFVSCSMSFVLFFALSAGQIYAAEPTLKETIEFIDAKFSGCGWVTSLQEQETDFPGGIATKTSTQEDIKTNVRLLESDKILFEESVSRKETTYAASRKGDSGRVFLTENYMYTGKVSLRDLTSDIDIDGQNVIVRCSRKDCMQVTKKGRRIIQSDGIIKHESDSGETEINEKMSASVNYFSVCDDSREKIAKALAHAIKISGGKKELF